MARLIDADDLIELLHRKRKTLLGIGGNTYSIKAFDYIIARITEQPTAYDVEKVVAEFEHEADLQDYLRENASARCNVAQAHIHRYAEQCYRNKAIEIVRKGGA